MYTSQEPPFKAQDPDPFNPSPEEGDDVLPGGKPPPEEPDVLPPDPEIAPREPTPVK